MDYERIFHDYKDELELALVQNCAVECELYSIIANILRKSESGRCVSIRDVSARRITDNHIEWNDNSYWFGLLEKIDSFKWE